MHGRRRKAARLVTKVLGITVSQGSGRASPGSKCKLPADYRYMVDGRLGGGA